MILRLIFIVLRILLCQNVLSRVLSDDGTAWCSFGLRFVSPALVFVVDFNDLSGAHRALQNLNGLMEVVVLVFKLVALLLINQRVRPIQQNTFIRVVIFLASRLGHLSNHKILLNTIIFLDVNHIVLGLYLSLLVLHGFRTEITLRSLRRSLAMVLACLRYRKQRYLIVKVLFEPL